MSSLSSGSEGKKNSWNSVMMSAITFCFAGAIVLFLLKTRVYRHLF